MPLPLSKTDICNGALQLVGQEFITDLDTDDSEEAAACRVAYARTRNELLEKCPWRFAQATTSLTADVTATNPRFAYSYQLPADFLAITEADADLSGWPYAIEGTRIVTDVSSFILTYTRELEQVGLYTGGFIRALEVALAARLAFALTKDARLAERLEMRAEDIFMLEAGRDAQLNRNQTYIIDSFLSVRNEGR